MNFVFLDIDGVLNNLASGHVLGPTSKYFDPVSVGLVYRLCHETRSPTRIIISSSWRNGDTEKLHQQFLELAPSLVRFIAGETPRIANVKRGEEIHEWASREIRPWDRYVVIDDDSDMLPGQPFVHTSFEDGFRWRHYCEAMWHLQPDHPDAKQPEGGI